MQTKKRDHRYMKKIARRPRTSVDNSTRIPKSLKPALPVPLRQTFQLGYDAQVVFSSATSFLVYDFRMNNVTVCDPLVSGSSAIGVPYVSAGYSQYRVSHFKMRYNFVTNEPSTPQSFGFTFKDFQPSVALTTSVLCLNSLMLAPATGLQAVGETTGSSVYRSRWYSLPCSAVLGDPRQFMSDKDFTGNFTTGPPQTLWASFVLLNPITANVGGVLTVNFNYRVHAYSVSPNAL